MKFLLIMQVCSALHLSCMNGCLRAGIYKTHFDCATAGYLKCYGFDERVGEDEVNRDRSPFSLNVK